jgi:hypothetical protein
VVVPAPDEPVTATTGCFLDILMLLALLCFVRVTVKRGRILPCSQADGRTTGTVGQSPFFIGRLRMLIRERYENRYNSRLGVSRGSLVTTLKS